MTEGYWHKKVFETLLKHWEAEKIASDILYQNLWKFEDYYLLSLGKNMESHT